MEKKTLPIVLLIILFFVFSCEKDDAGGNEELPKEEDEIIFIPDEIFKDALVNSNSVDTNNDEEGDVDVDINNDGEIQRSEAEAITNLILHFNYQSLSRYVDLTGIENFTELILLSVTGEGMYAEEGNTNQVQLNYDFTKLEKLKFLRFNNLGSDYIETINLSGLTNLFEITGRHIS